ncbi:MAG: MFS transporter [Promethearchaeota archaeon]
MGKKFKSIDLKEHQSYRYSIFGIIYLHQGFIEVFMSIYMSLYLMSFGVSILFIGLTLAIGNFPWIIKIFYGIVSDRKSIGSWGRRIPYMLIGSIFAAVLFFVLIPVNPLTDWIIFVSIIFIANFFNAISDTATDGLIVDITSLEKRGTAQSVCWGSKFVGYLIASILVGFMVELFSWSLYFVFMGFFLLIPIPMLLLSREPPYEIPKKFPWKDLKDTFKKRLVWIVIIMFILTGIGLYIVLSMLPLFLSIELQLPISSVGIIMAVGSAGFMIGCLISGFFLEKFSRRVNVAISVIFLSTIIFLVSLVQDPLIALIIVAFAGLAWGVLQITEMMLSMDISKKSIAATIFSVYMSIINIGVMLGPIVGAFLVELYSFRLTFVIAGFIVISNLIFIVFIKDIDKLFKEKNESLDK